MAKDKDSITIVCKLPTHCGRKVIYFLVGLGAAYVVSLKSKDYSRESTAIDPLGTTIKQLGEQFGAAAGLTAAQSQAEPVVSRQAPPSRPSFTGSQASLRNEASIVMTTTAVAPAEIRPVAPAEIRPSYPENPEEEPAPAQHPHFQKESAPAQQPHFQKDASMKVSEVPVITLPKPLENRKCYVKIEKDGDNGVIIWYPVHGEVTDVHFNIRRVDQEFSIRTFVGKKLCGERAFPLGRRIVLMSHAKYCSQPGPCKSEPLLPGGFGKCEPWENGLPSVCIIHPKPRNVCFVTDDNKEMWDCMRRNTKRHSMIDVGTNVGDAASIFPHHDVTLYGFDPMPTNTFWLHLNQEINKASGVHFPLHIFDGGASNKSGVITVTPWDSRGSAHVVLPGKPSVEHRKVVTEQRDATGKRIKGKSEAFVTTADDGFKTPVYRVSDVIHNDIGQLKLDIEGHEPEAVQGAIGLICNHEVDSLFTEFATHSISRSSSMTPNQYLKLISDLGFACNKPTGSMQNLCCKRTKRPSPTLCRAWGAFTSAAPSPPPHPEAESPSPPHAPSPPAEE